ncbi:element excision factor XisH family protein [Spirulina sp. 06S082]|nr:element excision factor XisH family protein [Spirulina sp. 06S082]MEA5472165.1 element excision factor XisH family protein [Spirulina sp. 06S082]
MRKAVPLNTFNSFFQERFVQEAVKLNQLKLIIYNPYQEEIIKWKE